MYRVLPILTEADIAECRRIAASATFVDGRISNPQMTQLFSRPASVT